MEFYRESDLGKLRELLSKLLVGMTPYTFNVSYQFIDVELTCFGVECYFRDILNLNLSSDAYLMFQGNRTIPENSEIPEQRADLVKRLMTCEEIISVQMADKGELTLKFKSELELVVPIDFSFGACEPSWVLLEEGHYRSDFGTFTDWYIGCDLEGPFGNLEKIG